MAEQKPRPGYLEIPIKSPSGDGEVIAYLSHEKAQHYLKKAPPHKYYELLDLVPPTLREPSSINAYDSGEWQGYCYARPFEYRCTNLPGGRSPIDRAWIFVVILTTDFVIIEWGWEKSSGIAPALTAGRLGDRLWDRESGGRNSKK